MKSKTTTGLPEEDADPEEEEGPEVVQGEALNKERVTTTGLPEDSADPEEERVPEAVPDEAPNIEHEREGHSGVKADEKDPGDDAEE